MCLNLVANLVWFGIETDSGSRDFSSPPKGSQVCDMIYADITYKKRIRCTLIVYWHFEIGGFFLHFTDFTVKIDGNRHSQRGTLVSRVCLNQDIGVVKPSLACWPYIWLLARTFHSFRTLFASAKFTHVGVLWNAAHRRFTPRKLTLHWKITIFKRKYIFKRWTFHCQSSGWYCQNQRCKSRTSCCSEDRSQYHVSTNLFCVVCTSAFVFGVFLESFLIFQRSPSKHACWNGSSRSSN